MTPEQYQLSALEDFISKLEPSKQSFVRHLAQSIRDVIQPEGELGYVALALVSLEVVVKESVKDEF